MAFLTMIAPLIAFTYPIDKIKDGKAQAFTNWFNEYLFNALLQPIHLLCYVVLVGTATDLVTTNILYAFVALWFISQAEKLVRDIFGLNKASTAPSPGAAFATGALASAAVTRLRSGSKLGSGKSGGDGTGNAGNSSIPLRKGFDAYSNSENPGTHVENSDNESNTNQQNNNNNNQADGGAENEGQSRWNPNLTQDQRDELEAQNIQPGDPEYDRYISDHGLNSLSVNENQNGENQNEENQNTDNHTNNIEQGNNVGNNPINQSPRSNVQQPARRRALRNPASALAYAGWEGTKKAFKRRFTGKKIARRLVQGVATAGLGVAGAMIGGAVSIATGKPAYFTAGMAGAAALGSRIANSVVDDNKINTVRSARWGEEEAIRRSNFKNFMKNDENIKVYREKHPEIGSNKEAREKLQNEARDFIEAGYGIDDVNKLMSIQNKMQGSGMSRDQMMAAYDFSKDSGIKTEDLMDDEKSRKIENNLVGQIRSTDEHMDEETARRHAQNHMNAMRVARGLSANNYQSSTASQANRNNNRNGNSNNNSNTNNRNNNSNNNRNNNIGNNNSDNGNNNN